jgi:hypothetical protein
VLNADAKNRKTPAASHFLFSPGKDLAALHKKLADAGVVASLRTDRKGQNYIRLSPHFYNTDAELPMNCRHLRMPSRRSVALPPASEFFREGGARRRRLFRERRPGGDFRPGQTVERRVFSQLGPGEIFGEMAVIEHRPRSATATALKDTDVYFLPRDEMLALLQRSPGLAFNVCCRKSATASANSTSSTCARSCRPNASPSSATLPAPSSTT